MNLLKFFHFFNNSSHFFTHISGIMKLIMLQLYSLENADGVIFSYFLKILLKYPASL